ncbi:MAG: putative DNA binding domain-containing protein [Verrucomicrobia bacterium]|nr:putative DNA binding domain-containing protein [Verrucomicrobiota bacterium]
MPTTPEAFQHLISAPEGARIEFKTAGNDYSLSRLVEYCVALANEGGGHFILGVSDLRPRQVVGSLAFPEPGKVESHLYERLRHRIPVEEYFHDGRRVLIVHVPSRLPGKAWSVDGKYLKRAGESLVGMGDVDLQQIFAEIGPDFTAEPCPAGIETLDPALIADFRRRWARKARNPRLEQLSDLVALTDADLLTDGRPNYAALILLGTRAALTRHLGQAEIVFEYRSSEASGPAQDREEYRSGFLSLHEALWQKINLRNDRQSYQEDFFRYDIPTFDEVAIREAILNAVAHRDYRHGGSIFIRQYARRLEIVSPGGFPPGITAANISEQQNPRNRRLAETLSKAGLVERAGQGMNLMIENAIKQTKPLPDFSGTDGHEVRLTLPGTVQNPAFIRFLSRLGEERLSSFITHDYLALDALQRDLPQPFAPEIAARLPVLFDLGIVERQGRGVGTRYLLSRELYAAIGQSGAYTRRKGLDHETNKALLLKHLTDTKSKGAPLAELCQVLPALSESGVQRLLAQLRDEGQVTVQGTRRWARWFLASRRLSMAQEVKSTGPKPNAL